MMMEANPITKQMLDFYQATFNNAFDAVVLLQDQFEQIANTVLDQMPVLPAEGRKAIESWAKAFKEGRKNFKDQIKSGFEQAEKLFVI